VGEGEGDDLLLSAQARRNLGQTLEIAFDGARCKLDLPLIGAYQAAERAGLGRAGARDAAAIRGAHLRGTARASSRCAGGWSARRSPELARRSMPTMRITDANEPAAIAALRPHVARRGDSYVFGAGGDRVRERVPRWARGLRRVRDLAIVTDDNRACEDTCRNPRRPCCARRPQRAARCPGGPPRGHCRRHCSRPNATISAPIAGKGHVEQGRMGGQAEAMRVLPVRRRDPWPGSARHATNCPCRP